MFDLLNRIFSLLSAILHLGNIRYKRKTYRDDSIDICNPEELPVVSELLEVQCRDTITRPLSFWSSTRNTNIKEKKSVCMKLFRSCQSFLYLFSTVRSKRRCCSKRWQRGRRWRWERGWLFPTDWLRWDCSFVSLFQEPGEFLRLECLGQFPGVDGQLANTNVLWTFWGKLRTTEL